jgi:mannitol operon repressor
MKEPTQHDRLMDESDRGFVLIQAAMIEQSIETALRAGFRKRNIPKKLQDALFDSNGPLSTFSGKLKIAFAFGIMSREDYSDV